MGPSRKPLMAANWKMHKTVAESLQFLDGLAPLLKDVSPDGLPDVVVCPPFTALHAMFQGLQVGPLPLKLGAQNMATQDEGAYTGEVSPLMLKDLQVQYVILGHSERRQYYSETDAWVHAKVETAMAHGLTPIICVGESLDQRESGETDAWVTKQVQAALSNIADDKKKHLVFAYEPIWAIGTGKVCEADEANRVIGLIRQTIGCEDTRILYGGSMKPDNVAGLMAQPHIDGGLVGGASLQPDSFFKLIQAAAPVGV